MDSTLDKPVSAITGIDHTHVVQVGKWLRALLFWAGSLAILAAFFLLGTQLNHLVQGFPRTAIRVFFWLVEVGAIWVWLNVTQPDWGFSRQD